MRRWLILTTLLAAALAFAATALADHGKGKDKGKGQPHPNKVTTTITTGDNGCSGAAWATDTLRRTLKVHRNADGSYRIKEENKGTFTTIGGVSPGNCAQNTSKHGTAVRAGVTGDVKGYIKGTVTG